jgi:hypothetical protein
MQAWLDENENEMSQSMDYAMLVHYAVWTLTNDGQAAAEYLGRANKGAWYAAAALADMNARDQVGAIQATLTRKLRPAVKLALEEAVERLRSNESVTLPAERMIWMLGLENPLELAQRVDTTNVFIQRAKGDIEHHEADDAMSDDVEGDNDYVALS